MAVVSPDMILKFTLNGGDVEILENNPVIAFSPPTKDAPHWDFCFRNGEVFITDEPVCVRTYKKQEN